MKKILSVILALSLVMSLAACGGNAAEPTTEAVEVPVSAKNWSMASLKSSLWNSWAALCLWI